ncbi:MAG: lipocalin-like domain-containing protein, partial [Phycisphaerales bacterium]|nr:lipocalin-like domain-containing protein [Phycisphaerales bacterium]
VALFPLIASLALPQTTFDKRLKVRPVRDLFVGGWRLVSYEYRTTDGKITHPMGESPVGRLVYDPSGRMSVQIMAQKRSRFEGERMAEGTSAEKQAAFEGYIAYYGRYAVDEAVGKVIHYVEASLFPNWSGTEQERKYEFASGGRLVLRAKFILRNVETEARLVWERSR